MKMPASTPDEIRTRYASDLPVGDERRVWMKNYPSNEEIDNAFAWAQGHSMHVLTMIEHVSAGYPPTAKEDCRRPELWKPEHWRWMTRWGDRFRVGEEYPIVTDTGERLTGRVIGYIHRLGGKPIVEDVNDNTRIFHGDFFDFE